MTNNFVIKNISNISNKHSLIKKRKRKKLNDNFKISILYLCEIDEKLNKLVCL